MFHAPRPHYHHRRRGRNDQGANISPMVIMLCMKVWQAYQDSPVKPPVKRSVQDLPRRWRAGGLEVLSRAIGSQRH